MNKDIIELLNKEFTITKVVFGVGKYKDYVSIETTDNKIYQTNDKDLFKQLEDIRRNVAHEDIKYTLLEKKSRKGKYLMLWKL